MLPVPTNISHDFHTNKTQTIQDGYIIKVVRGHSLSQFIGNFEEIILSSGHDHPNILLCKGFNFMNVKPDEWYTYIFYPRMKLSLADDLNARAREKQYYTTQELVTYMSTLLSVLEYLDKKDLAHTNIKPENVFFGNDGELLVSEIGSRSFHSSVLKEGASATVYTAPEAVKIQKGDVKTLIQGDVWSLGTLFMEMLTLKKVTQEFRERAGEFLPSIYQHVERHYGPWFVGLLEMMLVKDPSQRRSFRECRMYLYELFHLQVDVPIIPNPQNVRNYYREFVNLKKEVEELRNNMMKTTITEIEPEAVEEQKVLSRSNSMVPMIGDQANKQQIQKFHEVYENFVTQYDDLGHLDLQFRGSEATLNNNLLRQSGKLVKKLKRMRYLIVKASEMDFTPKAANIVANVISQIKSLESLELYLTQTALTDESLINMAFNATHLENLRRIIFAIGGTKITDKSMKQVGSLLVAHRAHMEELELFLWGTQISDELLEEMSRNALSYMNELRFFNISLNNTKVGDKGISVLFSEGIHAMKKLKKLEVALKETSISSVAIILPLAQGFNELSGLESLELGFGGTMIDDHAVQSISDSFYRLPKLKKIHLYFWATQVSDYCMKDLGKSLSLLKELSSLILSFRDTKVSDHGIIELNYGLKGCSLVDFQIYLKGTKIQNPAFYGIIASAKNISKFILEVCQSSCSDSAISTLAHETIAGFKNLRVLELQLWETKISDESMTDLGRVIGEMRLLHELDLGLGNSKITDRSLKDINKGIAKLRSLQRLDLDFQNTTIQLCGLTCIVSSANTLRSLKFSFGGTMINDITFKELCNCGIAKCRNLEKLELYFWSTSLSDVSLKDMGNKIIQPFALNKAPIYEKGHAKIFFRKLIFSFAECHITNMGFQEFLVKSAETLSQLEYLEIDISNSKVTDEGLKILNTFQNVDKFNITV